MSRPREGTNVRPPSSSRGLTWTVKAGLSFSRRATSDSGSSMLAAELEGETRPLARLPPSAANRVAIHFYRRAGSGASTCRALNCEKCRVRRRGVWECGGIGWSNYTFSNPVSNFLT